MTRGERNNNPGNLTAGTGWLGELGLEIVPDGEDFEPRFARFDSSLHGIRALAKQLVSYQTLHGCKTVREIINRWAPPVENNTQAYVDEVAGQAGIRADVEIDVRQMSMLASLTRAIILQENGEEIYNMADILQACQMALE